MPRPQLIDRRAVLDTAIRIADERGLAAVTMSAVGSELGVTAMALYRYVPDKAGLLDGMVEHLLAELTLPPAELAPLDRLAALGDGLRAVARAHPNSFPLLLSRPATTDDARIRRDLVIELLDEMGVPTAQQERLERLVSTVVLGFAVSEANGRFANLSRSTIDRDWTLLTSWLRQLLADAAPPAT
jgi:AcrR family transcriptional regulator